MLANVIQCYGVYVLGQTSKSKSDPSAFGVMIALDHRLFRPGWVGPIQCIHPGRLMALRAKCTHIDCTFFAGLFPGTQLGPTLCNLVFDKATNYLRRLPWRTSILFMADCQASLFHGPLLPYFGGYGTKAARGTRKPLPSRPPQPLPPPPPSLSTAPPLPPLLPHTHFLPYPLNTPLG